jgi:proline dehydrogenase
LGLKERVVLPLAKRWISGVDMSSVINDAKAANSKGLGAIINFLGEEIKDPAAADATTDEYLRLQQAMADGGVTGLASVKLTQLGLGSDEHVMQARLEKIAANSERLRQQLWIDMEGSAFTEDTVRIYLAAHSEHPGVGVALQAYARRSESDLKSILDSGGKVRLVKGAYRESRDFTFANRKEIGENFTKLMRTLFDRSAGFAIATHDPSLVDEAKKLADSAHTDFHFEFLKGIRDDLKVDLVKAGYNVSEYLPYGDRWYAYSKRRITEHPSNVWLLLRSLV